MIQNFSDFIFEGTEHASFQEFAEKRLAGAAKIAEGAKAKGGAAMLTYYHFVVKLPYYKKAAAGKWDAVASKKELSALNLELTNILKSFQPKDQIPFQKTMGKIEVVGELLIRWSSEKEK